MTIVSLQTGAESTADLTKVGFSDNSFLIIKNCYLNDHLGAAFIFEEGRELSSQEEEALRFAADCYRTERIGMRLIARAEQTEARLSYKLQGRGCPGASVDAVVGRFIELDLVNDGRYAERWLRSHLARMSGKVSGPRKLSAALRNRGIDRNIIKEAFDKTLDEEAEYALLQRFLIKNRKHSMNTSYLRGYLRYEGFSSSAISRYFDENSE
jgi:regulatory protein